MYAVMLTGGKQYRVAPGEEVRIDKVPGEIGKTIDFETVLLISDGENVSVGKPYLDGARVLGRITRQGKERKIVVFKYKRRKGYRNKRGHRQDFTLIRVENIAQ